MAGNLFAVRGSTRRCFVDEADFESELTLPRDWFPPSLTDLRNEEQLSLVQSVVPAVQPAVFSRPENILSDDVYYKFCGDFEFNPCVHQ